MAYFSLIRHLNSFIMNRYFTILTRISLIFLLACSKSGDENDSEINQVNTLTPIDKTLLSKVDSSTFTLPVINPVPILVKGSNLVIYDFAEGSLKQFNSNGFERMFYPIQEGPDRLGGEYFRGVGLIGESIDSLLIGSNKEISIYNFLEQKYSNIPVDQFPHCVSFNDTFQEIFFKESGEERVIISQSGYPCYELGTLYQSVTPDNFKDKFFLRIVSSKRNEPIYTLKLPDLKLKNLYERSRLVVTYNENDNKFYTMLNPLSYLFVYRLNEETLEMELEDYWNLGLKNSELPIDYFIEKEVNSEISNKSLDYNFELSVVDSFGEFVFVSYHPSKELKYDIPSEAPYSSHNFLAVVNLKEKKIKTFSLNYDEFQFFGASNGFLWIYDVESSEKSGYTVFKFPLINELWKK